MKKLFTLITFFFFGVLCWLSTATAGFIAANPAQRQVQQCSLSDTNVNPEAMQVINAAINASAKFDAEAVANLYAPNAVIADDEPPFSWNGPTAGIQWVNAVEQACKSLKISKLKVFIRPVHVFQQTEESVYVIVPVDYRGRLSQDKPFEQKGAFTFVVRLVSGKWLIKSQGWMPRNGM